MIFENLDHDSHLDFACTSQLIFQRSQGILRRHQEAHPNYHTVSDLDPLTIPKLVRGASKRGTSEAWNCGMVEENDRNGALS